MVYTPSLKLFALVAFLVAVLVQSTSAQFFDDDDIVYSDATCPEGSIIHYKNCRGSLDQCSRCLGDAERKCEEELKKQGKNPNDCGACTRQAGGNCNNIETMCFGNQECGGGDYKCIDRKCTYSPS